MALNTATIALLLEDVVEISRFTSMSDGAASSRRYATQELALLVGPAVHLSVGPSAGNFFKM